MIRVVYHWRVDPEHFAAFRETWTETTNRIHDTVPGALGSFLMRSVEDPTDVQTVAKWVSLDAWRAFFEGENPHQMTGMRELGERTSVVAYDEIGDQTR
ncbi:MAG: antibiotic biosynthesis monooxygenase family protein [Gemmatimonadota bacterium]